MSQHDYTIFCCPMKFDGITGIRQSNAITSWQSLSYPPEKILLISEDEGVREWASAHDGCEYVPGVETNEFDTPLISSLFSLCQEHSDTDLIAYVNSDIVLIGLGHALNKCASQFDHFLMISRRYDVDVTSSLPFTRNWQFTLSRDVRIRGSLHAPGAVDFFAFRKPMYGDVPPFAIGRSAWDNYLVIWARKHYIPVIDVSELVYSVHQNLSESGGNPMTSSRIEERRRNRSFYDEYRDEYSGSVKDADYYIHRGVIHRK